MTSKTRILGLLKTMDHSAILQDLDTAPELEDFRDERGRNWLHLCAAVAKPHLHPGTLALAAGLLERGFDINEPAFTEDAWQATPLWYAVSRGKNIALATFLLEQGSSPEHCLWAAAFDENVAMVELLLAHGAPLEAVAEGETPMLGAVKWSRFGAVPALLGAGADPDFRDAKQMTALHYMLKKNSNYEHFEVFAAHGARGDVPDANGRTARDIMSRKRDPRFRELAARLTAA